MSGYIDPLLTPNSGDNLHLPQRLPLAVELQRALAAAARERVQAVTPGLLRVLAEGEPLQVALAAARLGLAHQSLEQLVLRALAASLVCQASVLAQMLGRQLLPWAEAICARVQ
jgi:multidrug resistance efflux pump